MGAHSAGRQKSNKHAMWQTCLKCGLRLMYSTKGTAEGLSRSVGPLPEHVQAAQNELSSIYTLDTMNEKIFLGKLMEIKGRVMVASNGGSVPNLDIRARSRTGQALLASTPAGTVPPPTVATPKPKAAPAPKAAATPPTSVSLSPVEETVTIVVDEQEVWEVSGSS